MPPVLLGHGAYEREAGFMTPIRLKNRYFERDPTNVVTKATMQSLAGRVDSLEREVSGFSALKIELARIGERQDLWIEQLKDLNAAIRWMREPADDEPGARRR